MILKNITLMLAAGALIAGSSLGPAAGAQAPSSPPPSPSQATAPASPSGRTVARVDKGRQIATIAAALAGLVAFTAVVSDGGSSRPRPTSP
jgi:hypothetical protein